MHFSATLPFIPSSLTVSSTDQTHYTVYA
jgi:hypothetical protein